MSDKELNALMEWKLLGEKRIIARLTPSTLPSFISQRCHGSGRPGTTIIQHWHGSA